MTRRSLLLGLLLGLFIASFTYFNDQIVRNTYLIGNSLPIGVFGVILLVLLLVNPLLVSIREGWALKGGEIAVITAMGLAACGWPGSNLYRVSTGILAMPNHLIHFQSSWQANNLMSYVPGVSDELAQGHIKDWHAFARDITAADPEEATPAGRLKRLMTEAERGAFSRAAVENAVSQNSARQMTAVLNRLLALPDLYDPLAFSGVEIPPGLAGDLESLHSAPEIDRMRNNRKALVAAFPGRVLSPPRGMPVLVDTREREETVLTPLLEGRAAEGAFSRGEIPWSAWRPTIVVWTLVVLSLGVATVCLSLVVHRQWSANELLSYPVVRFLEDTLERKPGKHLPAILQNRLFWLGFGLVFLFHLYNGIATWIPAVPTFPDAVDISPLNVLFPNARMVPGSWGVFRPRVYFSVIAFAFYLDSRISLSLGMSMIFWVVFGAFLIGNGIPLGNSPMGAENGNLLRMGAYVGFTLMILYTGRRYYREAALASFGFPGHRSALPRYVAWAGRGMAAASALAVFGLYLAGLSWFWGGLLTLTVLMMFLVLGRIVAETGAFFIQAYWLPIGVFTALFGFEAIGPTHYIVMALASVLLVGDPRETLMPFILNGLKLGGTATGNDPKITGRLGLALLAMVLISFVVAGAVTLRFQYNEGIGEDQWASRILPSMPFQFLDRNVSELTANGTLSKVTASTGEGKLPRPGPEKGALFWMLTGISLVLIFAIARLRITWWPFHPVLFLVWGTFSLIHFWFSFFVGWIVKEAVVKTVGAKGFHTLKPLMVGVISAELLAAIAWGIFSLLYYHETGLPPTSYRIFPR